MIVEIKGVDNFSHRTSSKLTEDHKAPIVFIKKQISQSIRFKEEIAIHSRPNFKRRANRTRLVKTSKSRKEMPKEFRGMVVDSSVKTTRRCLRRPILHLHRIKDRFQINSPDKTFRLLTIQILKEQEICPCSIVCKTALQI